ncbi:MAG: DUF4406 domain-containing protein [Methanobacterium sp.]
MERVFISQPMFGKTNDEIRKERAYLVEKLEKEGYKVVDSIIAETPEEAFNEPVFYMSQSILLLSKSDCIYFMDGWDKARGCKIEHEIAKAYEIPILKD